MCVSAEPLGALLRAQVQSFAADDRRRAEERGGATRDRRGGPGARALRHEPLGARQEVALSAAREARQFNFLEGALQLQHLYYTLEMVLNSD